MFSAKKLSIVCATFGLTVLLSACGGGSSGNVGTTSSTNVTSATTTASPTTATSSTATATGTSASTVSLSWTPPTQNTDGTALTNLAGYKIYYGTDPNNLSDSVRVGANITSYMIPGFVSGTTYYFAIASVNDVGTESSLSTIASKSV